ncbi:CRISPR-associated endonuclease/helicase Cas3 [Actinobaculum suis]|uniref:CRISPR-associated endonuclease/helicase Cas3 n=1 Tax=Actinobaculum suis TaxID=1657 RepID=A0A1G7EIY2_9ACTO|nr:CRISPR-associated helicase/endonuclease Cas3 [Actinobaculum suis]MDY5152552.1 CRISPR-associated helicase/endonuclease Cas3 [Actinobaculum suis]SDE63356.1 CRISPR-associated endonuclease/helicase Cas3 [Actinobaculum suis]
MDIANRAETWLNSLSPQAHSLWAKSGCEDAYLRLTQHLIDTACVAEWLWDNWVSDSLKRTLVAIWKLDEQDVRQLYIFFAGVHDVGKATVSFQRIVERRPDSYYLLRPIEEAGLSLDWPRGEGPDIKFPHGLASAVFLRRWLLANGLKKPIVSSLISVVDAHHGFTSDPVLLERKIKELEGRECRFDDVAAELIESMADLTGVGESLGKLKKKPVAGAPQLMVGLLIMADWIASNENAFPYGAIAPQSERVAAGMEAINLPLPWTPVDPPASVQELFNRTFAWDDSVQVRPIQAVAVATAQSAKGPMLMIIEAPTGEGKTEAGLAAAHVLGHNSGAQGVYVAAPTMATANGLFERVVDWARHSSRGGSVASMYLAHSKNWLSEQFQRLRFGTTKENATSLTRGSDSEENMGEIVANQWLSGSRKGLLSDFVVGTVDQVLMMALKVRFSMLRHVALTGKVILIDEVHAYDAYMSQYLYRVLQWCARYGMSVILMSATLPPAQRKKLAAAYGSAVMRGAQDAADVLDVSSYPLVSVVDANEVRAIPTPPRPDDAQIAVHRIGDDLGVLRQTLGELLDDGGVALVICNTIRRAQEAYRELSAVFPGEVELHHSAFIASDRSEKEDALRERLGPRARRGAGRPWRQIIVATQVAEQSLDIDADVLITDIAPIDLIIQRAGRIHRHERPRDDRPVKLRDPMVFVRGVYDEDAVPRFDSGTQLIYGEAILLSTMAHLPEVIRRPSDVPELVRRVYDAQPHLPESWQERWDAAVSKDAEAREESVGRAQAFLFPYLAGASDLQDLFNIVHDDSRGSVGEEAGSAQVRDTEFSMEVIAVQDTAYGYRPFGNDDDGSEVLKGVEPTYQQAIKLAGSSLRLPVRMTKWERDFNVVVSELETQTPVEWSNSALLRGQVALRFDRSGQAHVGRFDLSYDKEVGLVVTDKEATSYTERTTDEES